MTYSLKRTGIQDVEHLIDLAVEIEKESAPGTEEYGLGQKLIKGLQEELKQFITLQRKNEAHDKASEAIRAPQDLSAGVDLSAEYMAAYAQHLSSISEADVTEDPKYRDMLKRVAMVHEPNKRMEWEDEDIIMDTTVLDEARMKCPLTMNVMQQPLTCTDCGHSFERDNIIEYITNKRNRRVTKPCPVAGCSATINPETNLKEDLELEVKLQRYRVQKEQAKKDLKRKAVQMSQAKSNSRNSRNMKEAEEEMIEGEVRPDMV